MLTKEEELNNYFEDYDINDEKTKDFIKYKFMIEENGHKEQKNIEEENMENETEILDKKIENEKKRFWEKYKDGFETVDTLISFVSLSNQKKEAFEKTLEIFDGKIKKIILLCTQQSASKLETFNFKGIELIKDVIENPDDFNTISYEIRRKVENGDIDPDKIIIDTTLGFKMVSLAFYKLSTEMNIKSVNWKQVQFINKDKSGRDFIVPGSDFINVIENPKLENYKLYKDINKAVENMNFEAAAYLYNSINNNSTYKIYNILNSIFSYKNLNDYDSFIECIKEKSELIREIKFTRSDKEKFNRVFMILENMAEDTSSEYEDEIISLDKNNLEKKYNNQKGIVDGTKFSFNKNNGFFLWKIIAMEVLKKRGIIDDKTIENIIEEEVEHEQFNYGFYNQNKILGIKSKICDSIETVSRYCMFAELMFEAGLESDKIDIDEIIDRIEHEKYKFRIKNIVQSMFNYKEEVGDMISIQNGKVIFTKYNIEIDEEKLLKPKKGEAASDFKYMIKLAIENAGKTDKKKLIERVDDREESKDYSSSAKEKAVSRVWSDMVKHFNEAFKKEIEIIGNKKLLNVEVIKTDKNEFIINEKFL